MRFAFATILVMFAAACQPPEQAGGDDYYYPPPGGGGGGDDGGGGGNGCSSDTACSSDGSLVCARTGECLAPTDVRTVHVSWTVDGAAASEASCADLAGSPLEIEFYDMDGDAHGYAPVPCTAGLYTIDKLPTRFYYVRLAIEDTDGGGRSDIDDNGNASLDLPY